MHDRNLQRLERAREALATEQVDALLIASCTNVSYLSGFTGDSSALLMTPDRFLMISDGRYTTQLEQECPGLEFHIRPTGQMMNDGLAEIIPRMGIRNLGLEADAITLATDEELREKMPTVTSKAVHGAVEALRLVKDESEIAAIRRAILYAERAFTMLRAGLRPDQTEKQVTDDLEAFLRRCGASSASFPPIVAVGANAALPHYHAGDAVRVADDDFMLVDWGASSAPLPYKSDLTRVLVTGKVTPKFANVYRTVLAAQERGIAAIRPGVLGRDVDAAARSVIEAAGFGPQFSHGLGHGIGIDIHEAPRMRKECQTVLQPGMVVTVEPGIYLPGWGGVRIEDDILVTPDGCEVLTHVPKSLETVRL
jgi:Xaa-Pro aminopeptidase